MKFSLLAIALVSSLHLTSQGSVIITGVVDGTNSGGSPKALEIVATEAVADLSAFFLLRDTNGSNGGTFTVSDTYNFPAVSLAEGEFFYVYSDAGDQTDLTALGFSNGDVDNILNHNGNDLFALATSTAVADVIDAFGLLGQGNSSFAQDSVSYRQAGTAANPTGVLDAGNFNITAYSDTFLGNTFGTYAVPEPSHQVLLAFAACMIAVRRKRG